MLLFPDKDCNPMGCLISSRSICYKWVPPGPKEKRTVIKREVLHLYFHKSLAHAWFSGCSTLVPSRSPSGFPQV